MRTLARLTFKLHRFEILAVLAGSLLLTVLALIVVWRIDSVGLVPDCFQDAFYDERTWPRECEPLLSRFYSITSIESSLLLRVMPFFALGAGILVGAPAVSRELERRTIALPWTLDGSRRRWLFRRLVILVGLAMLGVVPLALAAWRLEASHTAFIDPWRSFVDADLRGPILVARSVAALTLGALVGVLVGRQLPALIITGILAVGLFTGAGWVMDRWKEASATAVSMEDGRRGDHIVDVRYRALDDGRVLTYDQAAALQPSYPGLPDGATDGDWLDQRFEQVWFLVPAHRFPEAMILHTGLLLGAAMVAGAAALLVIKRRGAH